VIERWEPLRENPAPLLELDNITDVREPGEPNGPCGSQISDDGLPERLVAEEYLLIDFLLNVANDIYILSNSFKNIIILLKGLKEKMVKWHVK
jgi:hypothetical protein